MTGLSQAKRAKTFQVSNGPRDLLEPELAALAELVGINRSRRSACFLTVALDGN